LHGATPDLGNTGTTRILNLIGLSRLCKTDHKSAKNEPSANVRFGSLADILRRGSDVRFTPESRHMQCNSVCPLSANSGHGRSLNHSRQCIPSDGDLRGPNP
jgi:hypothetical protein